MNKKSTALTMVVFLLGIFMGAIDSGIVSPARDVIANGLNVSQDASVWVITIYTLAYAVSMPIMGKLSDKFGRKKIYMVAIILFGIGSLLCGISDYVNSYGFLLGSRVLEAIGGGGIMPIAAAYIGTSFPVEKRGSALGMIGGIYGIATVIGPTLGSGILSIFGDKNWGFLFLVNVPISIVILLLATRLEENTSSEKPKKLDILGSGILAILILSLMYGATNLKFYDFANSIKSLDVWPYLLIFIISIPLLVWAEKRAEDPVINLSYFTNKEISITLILSLVVGCGLMATVFIPQFSENILKTPMGTGGYITTIFAVFVGMAAPLGGKFIDKIGVKKVLITGMSLVIIGNLYQGYITTRYPGMINLVIGLAIMGFGLGFSMGTPINYLMLSLVPDSEATVGQSAVSLVKSIGIAVSPNILINFISDAGRRVPDALQKVMPHMNGMSNKMASPGGASSSLSNAMSNASVTNIFSLVKEMVKSQFAMLGEKFQNNPHVNINMIQNSYMDKLDASKNSIESAFQHTMNTGYTKLFLACSIIALVGLVLTLMLNNKLITAKNQRLKSKENKSIK
ncbi:MFS transporter [Clostridium sp.]|uniref:MFS transporter n=1 Tax=Clostridium sp. TaxID=1506 RepID=UPI00260E7203|nr:MFS transporter [Clostridium sp.]